MSGEEDPPPLPDPALGRGSRSGPFGEGGRAPCVCGRARGEPRTLSSAVSPGEKANKQGRRWRGRLAGPGDLWGARSPEAGENHRARAHWDRLPPEAGAPSPVPGRWPWAGCARRALPLEWGSKEPRPRRQKECFSFSAHICSPLPPPKFSDRAQTCGRPLPRPAPLPFNLLCILFVGSDVNE